MVVSMWLTFFWPTLYFSVTLLTTFGGYYAQEHSFLDNVECCVFFLPAKIVFLNIFVKKYSVIFSLFLFVRLFLFYIHKFTTFIGLYSLFSCTDFKE